MHRLALQPYLPLYLPLSSFCVITCFPPHQNPTISGTLASPFLRLGMTLPVLRAGLLLALLVSISSGYYTTTPSYDTVCPDEHWELYNGRCYWLSPFVAPWHTIGDVCRFAAPDAHPVSIHNSRESDFVRRLAISDAWICLRRYGIFLPCCPSSVVFCFMH